MFKRRIVSKLLGRVQKNQNKTFKLRIVSCNVKPVTFCMYKIGFYMRSSVDANVSFECLKRCMSE